MPTNPTSRLAPPPGDVFFTSTPDRHGHRQGLALDVSFCLEPTCRVAHVRLSAIEAVGEEVREDPTVSPATTSARIHLDRGSVTIDQSPLELARRLDALVGTPALAALLRERRKDARAALDRVWQQADWSDWTPGRAVEFNRLYPDSPLLEFKHEGTRHFVTDAYCIAPGCSCRVAHIGVVVDDDGTLEEVLSATLDIETDEREVGPGAGTPEEQASMFAALERRYPNLRSKLERRRREVVRAGPRIRALAGRAALPTTADTGRNAPCPCGSGRKYKKCCMT